MVDLQPMEEEFQGAVTRDVGTETHEGPTEPVLQTQKTPSPSPAFIKENIDVLRTMIKEHDQQAKMKATPRKLAYVDSDKEALAGSLAREDSLQEQRTDTFKKVKEAGRSKHNQGKDLTEIHVIKRRQNEGLQAFIDWFKFESSHIKGVPPFLRISTFMHGHGHPELSKKLNDKIPKAVDEMFERVRDFIRGEAVAGSQHQQLLLVKKANRGSYSLGEVGSSGEGHSLEQPAEWKSGKEWCKDHKHDKGRRK
ncbi:hypothetical protein Tco_1414530 [Tanacetum coccineum]